MTTGENDYSAHTPMMQQYRWVTILMNIHIGAASTDSTKSHGQSPFGPP